MSQELQKGQQQDYSQTRDRQHHDQEPLERDADRHFSKNTSANPETSRNEPGNHDDLGWSRQHLPRARHRGGCHEPASLLPGALGCPHDERHPSQRSHAMRPHQRTQRDAVKGKRDPGHRSRQPVPRPATRQKIHSESRQKQMRQTENSQRPGERQEQVEQRPGIHRQGVPFGQKRNAEVVQRIPQRHYPAPETFPVKKSLRIAKESVVAEDESAWFEQRASGKNLNINDVRKENQNEQRQQSRETPRREPCFRRLHTRQGQERAFRTHAFQSLAMKTRSVCLSSDSLRFFCSARARQKPENSPRSPLFAGRLTKCGTDV